MKIKVLHLINSMEPGGAESLLKSFMENADTEAFEYHLAYFYKTGSFLEGWKADIQIRNFSRNGRFSFIQLIKLYCYIKKNNFLILHTHLVQAGILGKLFGRLLHIPVIVSTRHHEILPKNNTFLYRFEDYLAKKFNTCSISISKSVQKFMIETGYSVNKLRLIPNGVDSDYFIPEPSLSKEPHSLISVGRLVAEKNFSLLIEAVNVLKNTYEDIRCTIIGDGPQFNHLSQKIAELNLQKNVYLFGSASKEMVKIMLQKSQVYISTSPFEGLPLSILEAMSLELPVIASSSGSVRDVIRDRETGFLINANDAALLATKVYTLFSQSDLRDKLGKAARQTIVENYSIKTLTAKTQALYRELLGQKGNA